MAKAKSKKSKDELLQEITPVTRAIIENLTEVRKQAGMTQQEFADALGVGLPYVKGYESGRFAPNEVHIFNVAVLFRKSLDWIFGKKANSPMYRWVGKKGTQEKGIMDPKAVAEEVRVQAIIAEMRKAKGNAIQLKAMELLGQTIKTDLVSSELMEEYRKIAKELFG